MNTEREQNKQDESTAQEAHTTSLENTQIERQRTSLAQLLDLTEPPLIEFAAIEDGDVDEDTTDSLLPLPAGGWAAVISGYQRANDLVGLVADLLTEAGLTVTEPGVPIAMDSCMVMPGVTATGAPLVRVCAGPVAMTRLRAWLSDQYAPPPTTRPPIWPGKPRSRSDDHRAA